MNTINWQPEHLENELIKLIPLTENHFESLYEVASDPLIWEQHPANDRYQREVFRSFFDKALKETTSFVIADQNSQKIIGSTRYYDFNSENSSIFIGYTFFARQYWGGVYNKALKKLLLQYAFQYVDKVCLHIGSTNIRSQIATQKIGAVKVREFYAEINGKELLQFEYVIEKNKWQNS
jgi:RimJ/RimL family protein N-acetyltransferase